MAKKAFFEKKTFVEKLVRRSFYEYYARNVLFELQLRARSESADYVLEHMPEAIVFENKTHFLIHCLRRAPAGAILEFGVATGRTITTLAKATSQTVHGFDSFEGLPEDWSGAGLTKGAFSRDGALPKVPKNVVLHKGWFKDTIDAWLGRHNEPIGLLHIDCDLYSSTRDALWALKDRIQKGTIIKFDEYFNYPNWQAHEAKAWKEFVSEFSVRYRYIGYAARDGSVAVEVLEI